MNDEKDLRPQTKTSARRVIQAGFSCKIGDCLKAADETPSWLELRLEEKFVAPNRHVKTLNRRGMKSFILHPSNLNLR
jgi:hypothetical protein